MGYPHQNSIVEFRINELTLGNQTRLLHSIRLWTEAASTMLWIFLFEAAFQRYNRLDMDEESKTPEHKLTGVEFHFFAKEFHTWDFP